MSDRIDRLRALTGQEEVYDNPNMEEMQAGEEDAFVLPEGFTITAQHVYEGTSEEDNTPPARASKSKKSKKRSNVREQQWKEDAEEDGAENLTARMRAGMNRNQFGSSAPLLYPELGSNEFPDYKTLEYGQLAAEGESFCSWKTVTQYPYQYVGNGNRPMVTERFFNNGKCYFQTWDLLKEESNQSPIFLVPTKQVEYFLAVINKSLGINLTIPSGSKGAFEAVFNNDGTPYPRYLGRALNKNMADELRENVPPRYYKLDGEPPITEPPVDTSFEAFRAKIAALNLTAKNKKAQNKERQKVEQFAKQRSWRGSTKRVQRYLGLRKRSENDTDHTSSDENTFYDPEERTKFMMEDAVVFICIDVEAYELNNNIVTEIGIATLDVLDIANMSPGVLGKNWKKAIRARHFRIKEHMHLNNTKHVHGCADKFDFGASEIISIDDAPHVVGTCFKYPFSDPSPSAELAGKKRNIILVGHDVDADIRFLRHIGYEINNLNLHECCDTTLMWRALHREQNPTKLSNILGEIGVTAWNLHNAGNDAVYTLQAMLGIACKHLVDRNIERKEKDKLKKDRISEAVKEAAEIAYELEEGWSSDGSDGGDRITPEQANAKKAADAAKKAASKREKVTDVNQLWRNGSKPEPATSSTSWASIAQGSNQASQEGWGTPPATPARNKNINTGSASRPQPELIPAEKFGYSSEYKSPAIKLNSSTSINTSFMSAADIKANFREQVIMSTKRIDGDWTWGQERATRDTKAVFIPTPTDQISTSIPAPINQGSASSSTNNTDTDININIAGLEQSMQNATLAELQEQGRIPADLSANAPKRNRRVKW